jgi:hypothetical protein
MRPFFRKLHVTAALIAIGLASLAPTVSVAQTTGLGWDGYTRELWRYQEQVVSVWLLDPNLNLATYANYGPYGAWSPVALTTGNTNFSYLLWRYPGGVASIWILDSTLAYVTSAEIGPSPGWTPENLSTGENVTQLRLTWRRSDGAVSIWALDGALNFLGSSAAGPYAGWDPGPAPEALVRRTLSVNQLRAMSAMRTTLHLTSEMALKRAHGAEAAARAMAQVKATKAYPTLQKL